MPRVFLFGACKLTKFSYIKIKVIWMEIYTLSNLQKRRVQKMASGEKPIDYTVLTGISKKLDDALFDAVGMMYEYPDNETYKRNVEELEGLKLLIKMLVSFRKEYDSPRDNFLKRRFCKVGERK